MAKAVKKNYDASSITWLEGLEGLREKPSMYLGKQPNSLGVKQLVLEILGNALDEANNNHGDTVGVKFEGDTVTVFDTGRGIPFGPHPKHKGQDTLTILATKLHAGGKLKASDENYQVSLGCFVGSTKIRLLNGKLVSIKKLADKFEQTKKKTWVMAWNKESGLAFVPRQAYGVYATRLADTLTEVILDSGDVIKCTPDHPFMLWGGEYCEASLLEVGDSLQGVYFSEDKDGYLTHSSGKRETTQARTYAERVNRTVMLGLGEDIEGKQVSHINAKKKDNRPSNLQVLENKEHWWFDHETHGKNSSWTEKSEEDRERSRNNMTRVNEQVEDIQERALLGRYAQVAARAYRDYGVVNESTYNASLPWGAGKWDKAVAALQGERNVLRAGKSYLRKYGEEGRTDNGGLGLNYKLLSEYDKTPADNINNHRVISVRTYKLKKTIQVYGMSVEADHNYLLGAGVFVKNTHGVGLSVTNALSTKLQIWSKRDGKLKTQSFSEGKATSKVEDAKPASLPKFGGKPWSMKTGTIVQWTWDTSVFDKGSKLDKADIIQTIRDMSWFAAYINKSKRRPTKFLIDDGKKTSEIHRKTLTKYIDNQLNLINKNKKQPVTILEETRMESYGDQHDFVGAWSSSTDDHFSSAVNSLHTPAGGLHLKGANDAIYSEFKKLAKKGMSFRQQDLLTGFIGCINIRIASPTFDGQGKGSLVSLNALPIAKQSVEKCVAAWIKKNKSTALKIIERASNIYKVSNDQKLNKQLAAALQTKKGGKSMLPPKLLQSTTKKPMEREIFMVEGDSAGGTCTKARDSHYQEVLPLRGKMLNVEKAATEKMSESQVIVDILRSIEYDPKNPEKELRVGKIMVLADPDPDGPLHGDTLIPYFDMAGQPAIATIKELAALYKAVEKPIKVLSRTSNGIIQQAYAQDISVRDITANSIEITFVDGTKTRVTDEHKWAMHSAVNSNRFIRDELNGFNYLAAANLTVGDRILAINEVGYLEIQSLTVLSGLFEEYYCMTVPSYGNFLVNLEKPDGTYNQIVSSNCHINSLILTLLWKTVPRLFSEDRVYLVKAPLFTYATPKKKYYGGDLRELLSQVEGKPDYTKISRVKGYGEMSPATLKDVAFNKDTRNLVKINDPGEYHGMISKIMGNDTQVRREMIGID